MRSTTSGDASARPETLLVAHDEHRSPHCHPGDGAVLSLDQGRDRTVGKHDPTRDGDVHPDTAKKLDPKEFEEAGQNPTDDDDNGDDD